MEMIFASAALLAVAFAFVIVLFWQCSLPNNKLSRRGRPIRWEGDWLADLEREQAAILIEARANEDHIVSTEGADLRTTATGETKHLEPIAV